MKCADVLNELWSGKKSEEIRLHLEICSSCSQEAFEIQQIVKSLRSIEYPKPSRSLLPNRDTIRQIVQKNRKKPWQSISNVAAVATILLAVGTGVLINHFQNRSTGFTTGSPVALSNPSATTGLASAPGSSNTEPAKPPAISDSTGDSEGSKLPDAVKGLLNNPALKGDDKSAARVRPSDLPIPPNNGTDSTLSVEVPADAAKAAKVAKSPARMQGIAAAKPDNTNATADTQATPDPQQSEFAKSISAYFNGPHKPAGTKEITVESFTADPQTEDRVLTGKAVLNVTLEPNAKSDFQAGKNEVFVLFVLRQEVWEVEKTSTSPLTTDDAPPYYLSLDKIGQTIGGRVTEIYISEYRDDKFVQQIHSIRILTDPDQAPNGTIRPSSFINIDFNQDMPEGLRLALNKGDRVIVTVGPLDPKVVKEENRWYSTLDRFFIYHGGKYYDFKGNVVNLKDINPQQANPQK
ncbi:hypothetical protein [Effusibacillus dendaii]|uniref:Zinc-finger domain-containing protein n=1 Tax=Effusibacillus dendaii TaxID=2743772 RepID=A0A7I8DHC7_9BACL|nr:hypothetical protein [Effusibacillus dendaii]BCJ87211.1 hypothetical protein skT53_21960 [Effusibacillus dendaii]